MRFARLLGLLVALAPGALGQQPGTPDDPLRDLLRPRPATSAVYIEPSRRLIKDTLQVSAGRVLQYDLTLERATTLVAEFRVSGGANDQLNVWLLDVPNYQRFLAGQQFSYFQGTSGTIRGVAKYTFRVPQTSIYYLVLDNRRAWLMSRTVQLYVYAILPQPSREYAELQGQLNGLYQKLKDLFAFSDFRIVIRHCGVENAFSDPNITLCMELIEGLGDQKLEQAIVFVFLHELGHSLLRLWQFPLWDNEDAADEFATVFMIIGQQQLGALQAAQWWASQTSQQDALAKVWLDDRHSVSPQRARNIIRWLNQEDELVRRWFRIFVPNMQPKVLSDLLNDPDPRVDKELVRGELRKRGYAPQ